MSKPIPPWKITMGHGADVLLAPAGAALAEDFGGKSAKANGLDGADCYLINKTDDGGIAVLCLLAKGGSGDPLLGNSYRQTPKQVGKGSSITVVVDPNTNLPVKHCYTRYSGWLILSPDDQNHAWLILTEPLEMIQSQVSALSTTAGPRALPAHDLTGPSARSPSNRPVHPDDAALAQNAAV